MTMAVVNDRLRADYRDLQMRYTAECRKRWAAEETLTAAQHRIAHLEHRIAHLEKPRWPWRRHLTVVPPTQPER
jgi:hypothetical protein